MDSPIFCVELVRGAGPNFPYGDSARRFQIFLPLRGDRCVDTDALRYGRAAFTGTRLRASDGKAYGKIVFAAPQQFVLAYEDAKFYPSTLQFYQTPIIVGGAIRICEYEERPLAYEVISVKRAAVAHDARR
ncbi:MAG TPA: hypothetical protein VL147_14460 [Devosia sp.]|nr:hypothetical protein [Devosia sp.]